MRICKFIGRILYRIFRAFVLTTILLWSLPYVAGYLAYGCTFGGVVEQLWLDKAIEHLATLKANCSENDPSCETCSPMLCSAIIASDHLTWR